ncbi:MAG: hypothetical protein R3F07_19050 [Opitutaceae bacterium]
MPERTLAWILFLGLNMTMAPSQQAGEQPYTRGALRYFAALSRAGVPAGLHLYLGNNHGYGMRAGPLTRWPEAARLWLEDLNLIARPRPSEY